MIICILRGKDAHVKFIFPTCSFEFYFKGIGQIMEEFG
jgi:hypothetical protein